MAPPKARKRAQSPTLSLDESEQGDSSRKPAVANRVVSVGQLRKRSRADKAGSNNDTNNRDWPKTVRAHEAGRVRQYLASFQDQVATAHDQAVQAVRQAEERGQAAQTAFCDKLRAAGVEGDRREAGRMASCTESEAAKADALAPHTRQPLHVASREVLSLLQAMLESYEQANEALKRGDDGGGGGNDTDDDTGDGSPHVAWDKDRAEARKLLRYGRVYGDSLAHDIIVPGDKPTLQDGALGSVKDPQRLNAEDPRLSQTGRSAIRLFARSRAVLARGDTWGETARAQMQALTELVKTLPTDGGRKTVSFEV